MCKGNSAIPSILQDLWDEFLKDENVMIILCGSAVSFIEKDLLSEKNPLWFCQYYLIQFTCGKIPLICHHSFLVCCCMKTGGLRMNEIRTDSFSLQSDNPSPQAPWIFRYRQYFSREEMFTNFWIVHNTCCYCVLTVQVVRHELLSCLQILDIFICNRDTLQDIKQSICTNNFIASRCRSYAPREQYQPQAARLTIDPACILKAGVCHLHGSIFLIWFCHYEVLFHL